MMCLHELTLGRTRKSYPHRVQGGGGGGVDVIS